MELEKRFNDRYDEVTLLKDNQKLSLTYAPNLDLYFTIENATEFVITKEDYKIYELFLNLYETIIRGDVFGRSTFNYYINDYLNFFESELFNYEDYSKEIEKELKVERMGDYYNNLVKGNRILWKCDDYPHNEAPSFEIIKEMDKFIIKFERGESKKEYLLHPKNKVCVRIRTSGSYYNYYFIPFMKLFKELKVLNLDGQIHIEEYLYTKKLK